MENKEYTWCPENADTFYETYSTAEECISVAKHEYDTKTGEFYGNDERYSPLINVGIVEHIDYDGMVDYCLDSIIDAAWDYVDSFAVETNAETECSFNKKDLANSKAKLKEIIQSLFINPTRKMHSLKMKYDLNKNGWIDE